MKIAVPTENGMVSAHFGRCPEFTIAEIMDGKIVITLTVPGRRNGNLGSEIAYISLNPSNFSGTMESIGIFSDKIEVSEGTITLTTCP